jgi:CspA family cold shock protein
MYSGTVSVFKADRGFGFIRSENFPDDIFFHKSGVGDGLDVARLDYQKVTFEVEQSPRGPRAVNIQPAE